MAYMDLSGKIAIVTGSTRGIGLSIAQRLAGAKCSVAIVATNIEHTKKVAGLIQQSGRDAAGFCCDVSDAQSVRRMVAQVLEKFGKIDILVNNAGIVGRTCPIQEVTDDEWHKKISINLTGVFYCCREIIPHMIEKKTGRIINISSMSAKDGNAHQVPYSASKAGVIALTKALGKEVAQYNIFVNAITPAAIRTEGIKDLDPNFLKRVIDAIPMGRMGHPEEVAAMVHWLASDEISFSTGAIFDLSGGRATY